MPVLHEETEVPAPHKLVVGMLSTRQFVNAGGRSLWQRVVAASYHKNVVEHYENPRNVGKLDAAAPNVGTGIVGAPACGDVMKLQIEVDENGRIVDSKFKTFGCGSAIASSSLATEWVKGRTLDDVLTIKNADIAKHLNLPPVKLHCSMLAEDAIKAAVRDLKAKQDVSEVDSTVAA